MKKIVITGPESTGKSTLAKELSSYYNIPFVNEYARQFINELDRDYNESDLVEIAKGQLEIENEVRKLNPDFLLCDTDLITVKIWSEFKYGSCDKKIIDALHNDLPDYYLLCYPDIDWKLDDQRENPDDRKQLFEIYQNQIEQLGVKFHIIKGENRKQAAVELLDSTLVSK